MSSGGARPIIGIDVTAALTQGGGIGRYTRELVGALAAGDDGFHYRLFSARPPAELPVRDPLPSGPRVSRRQAPLSDRWLYRIWHRLELPLPLQWFSGRLDLFHSPDFVLPPLRPAVPALLTVHDLSFIHYPETFTPALVAYLRRVVPRSVARADRVLADSEATKADLMSLWAVPEQKITVLYSGVAKRFRPVKDEQALAAVRSAYGLGAEPYVLSVSTVQPRKNYRMLIRAFAPLAARWPHNLVIAGGKGWLYEEILAEVEAQGLTGRVIFTGFVDDADLPALYGAADLFAFPSLYEGFGLPVLEAMACGVPVIVSDVSSLPEVAGEAAKQLAPDDVAAWTDAMATLLGDAVLREQMVNAGRKQAAHFSWDAAAEQLRTVYRELLGK